MYLPINIGEKRAEKRRGVWKDRKKKKEKEKHGRFTEKKQRGNCFEI